MNNMNQNITEVNKRPFLISALCVLSFIGAILVVPMAMSEEAKKIRVWYPHLLIISGVIGLICNIGIWKMKKWAVYGYIILTSVVQIIFISTGLWTVPSLIVPGLYILMIILYFKRMN